MEEGSSLYTSFLPDLPAFDAVSLQQKNYDVNL